MERQRILVIGGGIAGLTAALEAASHGSEVFLVEKKGFLGGKAYEYCCKATEKCNKCSACLVPQAKSQVENHRLIKPLLNSQVTSVTGGNGDFKVKVKNSEGEVPIEVASIIVATGFEPFDASLKGEFGYKLHDKVITGLDLEGAIRNYGSLSRAYGNIKRIGFIQCVGSRDLQLGNAYCSKVCCMYATKLAKLIRSELPEAEISIFYMDLQTFGKGFDEFIASCKDDENIQFIRGIPSKVYSFPYDSLTVKYSNSLTGEALEDMYDLIVLSSAITPGVDTAQLGKIMNLELDEFGFFKTNPVQPYVTNQEGIYLAGTCQSPKDIPQCIAQAKAAVYAAVTGRKISKDAS